MGDLYKRLLNHRPVIQNEVHYFLKEFGGVSCSIGCHLVLTDLYDPFIQLKREDSGPKNLQDAMKFANEMDTIFLEEIAAASHQFKQVNALSEYVCAV